MKQRIDWKDHLYLAIPFIMMLLLYQSSSMTYEEQSMTSAMEVLLEKQPLDDFLTNIEFVYGGQEISIQKIGYFSFIEFFIRKGAHFGSYFIIGFFWFLGLRKRINEEWLTILVSILLAIGYASFDELRQSFNPGRTALMADVYLDTAGALVGILLAKIFTMKKIL